MRLSTQVRIYIFNRPASSMRTNLNDGSDVTEKLALTGSREWEREEKMPRDARED